MVSVCYLHCFLKGLHKAPGFSYSKYLLNYENNEFIGNRDIDFMVSPADCYGKPHKFCEEAGIPIIVVAENKTVLNKYIPNAIYVKSYLEATGFIKANSIGITPESVTRPMPSVQVIRSKVNNR